MLDKVEFFIDESALKDLEVDKTRGLVKVKEVKIFKNGVFMHILTPGSGDVIIHSETKVDTVKV